MDIQKEREAYKAALRNLENEFFFATPFDIWLAAKREAQAVPKGNDLFGAILDVVQKLGSGEFVLLKNDSKTIVAIEQMVEQQVEASGMDSRCLERLDGEKILQAAIEAQEPAND